MSISFIFILGFVIALVGVIPPGLLNMTAAKVSIKDGHTRGLVFSAGVCVVVIIQTVIAFKFANYLSGHPDVVAIFQRVAFVIFVLITIYFLLVAKKKEAKSNMETELKSKKSRFFQGVLLSGLNIFPIPYQAYMSTTLASFGWLSFDQTSEFSYVAGAAMGTFVMLYVYVFFFEKIKNQKMKSQKNMNYSIGIITGIISIVTLINIIKEW